MWIPLTVERVDGRLSAPERDALLNAAKGEEQTPSQLMADAIEVITREVRGSVAACDRNTLGPAGTIPDELESAALALVRRYLFTRLPGMKRLFDELRQEEAKSAERRLERAAECRIAIVPPEEAGDQAAGPAVQLVASRDRIATREAMKGL